MSAEANSDREQVLVVLNLAMLTAEINGQPLSPELKDQINRASQGDESIDVQKLLEQVNDALPDLSSAVDANADHVPGEDPLRWTFDEGVRASCDAFTIGIPDGYRVVTDYDDIMSIKRPFVAVHSEVADKDIPNADRIICSFMPSLGELQSFKTNGIDELYTAFTRNAQAEMPTPNCPHDWIVRGKNCDVVVERIVSDTTGFEYYILPASTYAQAFVRLTFYNTDASLANDVLPSILALAQTAESTSIVRSELKDALERCRTELVDEDALTEALGKLYATLNLCMQWHFKGLSSQFSIRDEYDNEVDDFFALLNDFDPLPKRVVPYIDATLKILEAQQCFGIDPLALKTQQGTLTAMFALTNITTSPSTPDQARAYIEHGPTARPEAITGLLQRADALYPGFKAEREQGIKEQQDNDMCSAQLLSMASGEPSEWDDDDEPDWQDEDHSRSTELDRVATLCCDGKGYRLQGTHKAGRRERCEALSVGDPVVLAANWNDQFYTPAAIEVLNLDGESLGYISADGESYYNGPEADGHTWLPFLLPNCIAIVANIKRGKSRYANVTIKLELDEELFGEDGMLKAPVDERVKKAHNETMAIPAEERPRIYSRRPGDNTEPFDIKAAATNASTENSRTAIFTTRKSNEIPEGVNVLTVDYLGLNDSFAHVQPSDVFATHRDPKRIQAQRDRWNFESFLRWCDESLVACFERDLKAKVRPPYFEPAAIRGIGIMCGTYNTLRCSLLREHVELLSAYVPAFKNDPSLIETNKEALPLFSFVLNHANKVEKTIAETQSMAGVTVNNVFVPAAVEELRRDLAKLARTVKPLEELASAFEDARKAERALKHKQHRNAKTLDLAPEAAEQLQPLMEELHELVEKKVDIQSEQAQLEAQASRLGALSLGKKRSIKLLIDDCKRQLSVVDEKIKANSKKRQPLKEWMDRAQEAEEQIKALEHELKEQEEKLMRARERVENL